jgi:NADP-dependent 3-hydroxy acid dehydrogenase YdfG
MSNALTSRVALVTGASSGIGRSIALALAAAGARVVAGARREDRLADLVKQIKSQGGSARSVALDVTKRDQIASLMQQLGREEDRLDILINNAGVMLLSPVAEADPREWQQMLEVNLLGLMNACQLALPLLKRSAGHIVNVSSVAGRVANPAAGGYAASKFGVVGFSESLRREVYQSGIRVTVIEPGMVATELGQQMGNEVLRRGPRAAAGHHRAHAARGHCRRRALRGFSAAACQRQRDTDSPHGSGALKCRLARESPQELPREPRDFIGCLVQREVSRGQQMYTRGRYIGAIGGGTFHRE